MKTLGAFLLVIFFVVPAAYAQLEVFNEHITQPDAWRPAQLIEPGVNAQGDLNLSLPVLTVPGRGGLDYPILLNYRSSITAAQPSSWVGLGWSFDPGSISRNVQGMIRQQSEQQGDSGAGVDGMGIYNVDFADLQLFQPDGYYVSVPGGGFTMARHFVPPAGMSYVKPPRAGIGDFYATEWQPWKIEYDTPQVITFSGIPWANGSGPTDMTTGRTFEQSPTTPEDRADFTRFVITSTDGTRYIFEEPTMSQYRGMQPDAALITEERYIDTWRLVAILGADYDGKTVPDPLANPAGSWVVLSYGSEKWVSNQGMGIPFDFRHTKYLESIHTPTHVAHFEISSKASEIYQDPDPWDGITPYAYLTEIKLYAKTWTPGGTGTELIRTAQFDISPSLGGWSGSGAVTRYALNGVTYFGADGSLLPGYQFEYYPTQGNGFTADDKTDLFGYYNSKFYWQTNAINEDVLDAHSWSLEKTTYPTGGWEYYFYENDAIQETEEGSAYCVPFSKASAGEPGNGNQAACFDENNSRQGGTRIKAIQRHGGSTATQITNYEYGFGRVSGVPDAFFPRNGHVAENWFKPHGRGKTAVFYTYVRKINHDGTYSSTYYTTDVSHPGAVVPVQTTLFQQSDPNYRDAHTTIRGNQDINWGQVYKVDTGGTGHLVESTKQFYFHNQPLAPVFESGGVYVQWRFAEWVDREDILENYTDSGTTGSQGNVEQTRLFTYDRDGLTGTGMNLSVEEQSPDLPSRITEKTYGYQVPALATNFEARNILSAVVREDMYEVNAGQEIYHRASATTWATPIGTTFWKPYQTYQWNVETPQLASSPVGFDGWITAPTIDDWQLTSTFASYGPTGQVLEVQDALGVSTNFFYGEPNGLPCTNPSYFSSSGGYHQGYLTCIQRGNLQQTVTYLADGKIATITDSNGRIISYFYDGLDRLDYVENDRGDVVASYAYYMSRDGNGGVYEPLDPNSIAATTYRGTGGSLTSIEYLDGLGRTVQTVMSGTEPTVAAVMFDPMGRLTHTYKPYYGTSLLYDPGYAAAAQAQYTGINGSDHPYVLQEYDGSGRLSKVYPPGEGAGSSVFQQTIYGTQRRRDSAGNLQTGFDRFTTAKDEDGIFTETHENAYGHQFLSRQHIQVPANGNEPDDISLSASISGSGGGGPTGTMQDPPPNFGPGPCAECGVADMNVFVAPSLDVNFDWDYDTDTFVATRTQSVHYQINVASSIQGRAAHVLFEEGGQGGTLLMKISELGSGTFTVYAGKTYAVTAAAGVDPESALTSWATCTLSFTENGMVNVAHETRFDHDALGNVVQVKPPNFNDPPAGSVAADWITHYSYNTLGQLTAKSTPDTDGDNNGDPTDEDNTTPDFAYLYDIKGNLRFAKDPNVVLRVNDGFLYTKYDAFNRITETGVFTGSGGFTQENADNPAWPGSGGAERVVYVYDTYTLSAAPYAEFGLDPHYPEDDTATPVGSQLDGAGRLTQLLYEGGFQQYFYDDLGRLAHLYLYQEGIEGKLTAFEYDLIGNITKVIYQPYEADESLYFWYTYDDAGRLSMVRSNTEDDENEAVQEAHYVEYTPSGQIKQLQLGDPSYIDPIDYEYHIRDWLTQINDPANLGNDIFAMRLGYEVNVAGGSSAYQNGNISSVEWNRSSDVGGVFQYGPSTVDDVTNRLSYSFEYDLLNRLQTADFGYYDGGWQNDSAYDVGVSNPIAYDANGNIQALTRNGLDETQQLTTMSLSYTYAPGSNRLHCVEGLAGLDCTNPFVYDANGNMTKSRIADTITHDRRNLPLSMELPDDKRQEFRYDADGQRIYTKLIDENDDPIEETYYVRGVGGTVMAVYTTTYEGSEAQGPVLKYWNILAGGTIIGRIEAGASGASANQGS